MPSLLYGSDLADGERILGTNHPITVVTRENLNRVRKAVENGS